MGPWTSGEGEDADAGGGQRRTIAAYFGRAHRLRGCAHVAVLRKQVVHRSARHLEQRLCPDRAALPERWQVGREAAHQRRACSTGDVGSSPAVASSGGGRRYEWCRRGDHSRDRLAREYEATRQSGCTQWQLQLDMVAQQGTNDRATLPPDRSTGSVWSFRRWAVCHDMLFELAPAVVSISLYFIL